MRSFSGADAKPAPPAARWALKKAQPGHLQPRLAAKCRLYPQAGVPIATFMMASREAHLTGSGGRKLASRRVHQAGALAAAGCRMPSALSRDVGLDGLPCQQFRLLGDSGKPSRCRQDTSRTCWRRLAQLDVGRPACQVALMGLRPRLEGRGGIIREPRGRPSAG